MNFQETTILYVDDDDLSRETVARRLRRMGIRVLEADSVEAAFSCIELEGEIDLLLLEPAINQGYGLELYRSLTMTGHFLSTVICTAAIDDVSEELVQATKLPVVCYCRKPCSFSELSLYIKLALKQSNTQAKSH